MHTSTVLSVAALLTLAACANVRPSGGPSVSFINSLSFDNAVSGKRDGLRSAWPADKLARSAEAFPMGQVKLCDAAGRCKWGVLKARRNVRKAEQVPGGLALELEVAVDVARSHSAMMGSDQAAVTIPADVGALQAKSVQTRNLVLEYGKVVKIDFPYGVSYEMCAFRRDGAGQAMEKCEIGYF